METTLDALSASVSRRAVLFALVLASLVTAPISWIVDGVTPSFVVYPLVLLFGLWRMRRGGGTLYFAIAATVFLVVHLPWTWAAFTGELPGMLPDDLAMHRVEWAVSLFVVPLLTALAGAAAWRRAAV